MIIIKKRKKFCVMYDWLLTNFSRKNQSIDSIDWLNLLREIEGRHTAIQLDAGRGRFSFLFTTPNLTNNAVERMCRTLEKKKRNEKERKWKKNNKTNLSEEAYLFLNDETFFASMWHEIMYLFPVIACGYFLFAMKMFEWMVHLWRRWNVETSRLWGF